MQTLRNSCLSIQNLILSLVLAFGFAGATSQSLRAQSQDSLPASPNSAATQSLADHPLVGWWMVDAEKTAEEMTATVKEPALRERMLGSSSIFHFHFRDSGDCTVLIGRFGEGTWSEKTREAQQGEVTIRIGNNPTGFKFAIQDPERISLQPDGQPFRIFLRRLKAPTVDPERLNAVTAQLAGTWRVAAEKTKALHTARKFPSSPEIEAMLPKMSWELKEDLLQPTKGVGPSLTLSPLVADVDDWQAKDWNGVILGKTNLSTAYSWEFNQGESILVIEGMPVVVERIQASR